MHGAADSEQRHHHEDVGSSVVLVLMSYKQEKTVGYSVDSVLRQDYEGPLTIILSDDCSPDRTFEIMKQKASAYDGRHRVILNRNENNMGITAHLAKVAKLVQGDYFCRLDGDDYAFSDRVSRMVKALDTYPDATIVTALPCKYYCKKGEAPDFAAHIRKGSGEVSIWPDETGWCWSWGGQVMYRSSVLDGLDDVFASHRGFGEDRVMEMLSRWYGKTLYIDRELTAYVIHDENTSVMGDERHFATWKEYKYNRERFVDIARKRCEMYAWVKQWAAQYKEKHHDIPEEGLLWEENFYKYLENMMQDLRLHIDYHDRGSIRNILHWIRNRDVRYTWLIPLPIKWLILGIISLFKCEVSPK